MGDVELLETRRKAGEAEQLLNNPLLKDAVQTMEKQTLESMLNLDMKDDEGLRRHVDTIKAGRRFLEHLHMAVQNGELAQFELEQMKGPKKSIFAP